MMNTNTYFVACFGFTEPTAAALHRMKETTFQFLFFSSVEEFCAAAQSKANRFGAVLCEGNSEDSGLLLRRQLNQLGFAKLPFISLSPESYPQQTEILLQQGITEIIRLPLDTDVLMRKLSFLVNTRQQNEPQATEHIYRMPLAKRCFDIFVASFALLLLSPILLLVAFLIRLESKGPVLYYSLRVGTGYRIFRFYKFRSMSTDADKKLSQLKHLNQYSTPQNVATVAVKQQCDDCAVAGAQCPAALYADNEMWCEKLYKAHLLAKGQQAFVKIKDDPRITRVGKFIRNTSIDELPQLWNVIKGDMSLVGNRPLPLYEAEKLTTDKYALRFMAPAGLTGLWQVSKRGGGEMSEEERISLDNDYAKSYGLWFDLKLLMRTIPALLQKENV